MDEEISINGTSSGPLRSHHRLSRNERLSGLANRFVFSSFYIWLYLSLALLSTTTVILSLLSECPTLLFYILELVINLAMIAEVCIRFVAFGKKFWASIFNIIDLILMCFCVVTVLVIFFSGCSAKGEEVFDTFLLVARNLIQFSRLAIVLRRSGRSIFTKIPAIDLSTAHEAAYRLDFDLEDEEAEFEDRRADGGDLSAIANKSNKGGSNSGNGGGSSSGGQTNPFLSSSSSTSSLNSRSGTPVGDMSSRSASASQAFLLADEGDDDDAILQDTKRT